MMRTMWIFTIARDTPWRRMTTRRTVMIMDKLIMPPMMISMTMISLMKIFSTFGAIRSVSEVNDKWFANEEKVRMEVGLLERPVVEIKGNENELTCEICFDTYCRDEMKVAICGHHFRNMCWIGQIVSCKRNRTNLCYEKIKEVRDAEPWPGYIHTSINDGLGCLTLCCPDPSCNAAVGEDMVLSSVSAEDRSKYSHSLLRSYIEDNRKTKWCPALGCEYEVDFNIGSGPYDVICKSSFNFCWNCCEEAHCPVDCEIVEKWILKNSAESENMNWILANSKPCPKCKRPIEKNQGCMHITRLCLGAWSEHGERTGGFYTCNRYEAAK